MRRPGVGSPTIMEMTEMQNPTFLAAGTALLLSALAGCGTTPPTPEQAADPAFDIRALARSIPAA